jgi:hypothetical protein
MGARQAISRSFAFPLRWGLCRRCGQFCWHTDNESHLGFCRPSREGRRFFKALTALGRAVRSCKGSALNRSRRNLPALQRRYNHGGVSRRGSLRDSSGSGDSDGADGDAPPLDQGLLLSFRTVVSLVVPRSGHASCLRAASYLPLASHRQGQGAARPDTLAGRGSYLGPCSDEPPAVRFKLSRRAHCIRPQTPTYYCDLNAPGTAQGHPCPR